MNPESLIFNYSNIEYIKYIMNILYTNLIDLLYAALDRDSIMFNNNIHRTFLLLPILDVQKKPKERDPKMFYSEVYYEIFEKDFNKYIYTIFESVKYYLFYYSRKLSGLPPSIVIGFDKNIPSLILKSCKTKQDENQLKYRNITPEINSFKHHIQSNYFDKLCMEQEMYFDFEFIDLSDLSSVGLENKKGKIERFCFWDENHKQTWESKIKNIIKCDYFILPSSIDLPTTANDIEENGSENTIKLINQELGKIDNPFKIVLPKIDLNRISIAEGIKGVKELLEYIRLDINSKSNNITDEDKKALGNSFESIDTLCNKELENEKEREFYSLQRQSERSKLMGELSHSLIGNLSNLKAIHEHLLKTNKHNILYNKLLEIDEELIDFTRLMSKISGKDIVIQENINDSIINVEDDQLKENIEQIFYSGIIKACSRLLLTDSHRYQNNYKLDKSKKNELYKVIIKADREILIKWINNNLFYLKIDISDMVKFVFKKNSDAHLLLLYAFIEMWWNIIKNVSYVKADLRSVTISISNSLKGIEMEFINTFESILSKPGTTGLGDDSLKRIFSLLSGSTSENKVDNKYIRKCLINNFWETINNGK